jgi:hypothetical protein
MKYSKILILLAGLIILSGIVACDSQKEMAQRRNLMIPQKDELPRNSKYTGVKKRKAHKPHKKRHRKHKRLTWIYSTGSAFNTIS